MSMRLIESIYFMVHPSIYAASRDDPEFAAKYRDYIEYEEIVRGRWLEAMGAMGPKQALVAFSPATEELAHAIESRLGPRGLIVRENIIHQQDLWEDLLGPDAKKGLGRDLVAMFWRHGYRWDSSSLVQPVIARGWAERLKEDLKERGMYFDPASVRTEGWGESFEGCVANYTSYLGTYLGLANPIEPNFEMTVPDARFLLEASLMEKVPMKRNVRLYLWEASHGVLVGWFHRALASIGDPLLYSEFDAGSMNVEVRGKRELYWPVRDSDVAWADDRLKVPILRDHFILARGAARAEFGDALKAAEIVAD